jgi:hypothetical protein
MACLNLTELRSLEGAERAFLEDAAKNIEIVIANAKDSALRSGFDVELMEGGLVTTLIVTAASFAVFYDKSADQEAMAFAVMRCMAEALFDVMGFSSREDLERRLNLPKQ